MLVILHCDCDKILPHEEPAKEFFEQSFHSNRLDIFQDHPKLCGQQIQTQGTSACDVEILQLN